jgi:hypothetical protein
MNMNKDNKQELCKAIQDLYINTRKVNSIAGNSSLDKSRFANQLETVKAELKETNKGLKEGNLGEVVDGCGDLLVTLSEFIMIIDGNTDLLHNPPQYLNSQGASVEELVEGINDAVNSSNFIDALGLTEDLAFQLNADMVHNLYSIGTSNLSKFILAKDLDESSETEFSICETIEAKGRYTDVYSETTTFDGEDWVVFKSKYDVENDEHYVKGKFLKCFLTFQEPELIIYE